MERDGRPSLSRAQRVVGSATGDPIARAPRAVALILAGALSLVALAACATGPASADSAATAGSAARQAKPSAGTAFDKPVPDSVAALPLVDQDGHVVTLASLHGQTVVLADFLTLCQEICPLTSVNLRAVDAAVKKAGLAGRVRILEVTVDPERDTPARLAAYQKLFGPSSSWSFLTGSTAQLTTLWKSFGVGYERAPESAGPPAVDWLTGRPLTFDIDHQDVVFVLGPDGHERWVISGTPYIAGSGAVPQALQSFLNDDGRSNESAPAEVSWTPADVEGAITYVTGVPVG